MTNPNKVVYFAETDARNSRVRFGIKQKDRSRHIYVIGKTGMGKSTLLENMAAQDIQQGNGMCFIDPHGKTAELLLEYIPKERINDVLYFAPFDMEHPISFNIMEDVGYDKRHLVVSGLMSAFKKIWKDAWSARMEYILSNTLFALLEYPDATLLSVNRMLSDKAFRKKVVENIQDTAVKSFWVDEFANYTERMAAEAVPAIQNKVGQFTSNPLIRNIIGQPKSSFDLREMMDNKKIIIVNLSKGRMGESNAQLLGSLLVTKIYLAAMSRADAGPHEIELLPDFSLFVDEFQSFANESFADILSEARKYKLNLHIAHQYVEQMPEEVRAAVFGNVGTLVTFRVGSADAELFEKEFAPVFTQQDIVNLGFAQVYLRLMIDGIGSKPFSARTMPPLPPPEENSIKEVVDASRRQFARPRAEVEEQVKTLTNMGRTEEQPKKQQGSQNNQTKRNPERNNGTKQDFKKESEQQSRRRDKVIETRPAISKDKELELKKQIEEAKKKAIDELDLESKSSEEVVESKTMTLKEITPKPGQKEVTKENKNALKDALLKVLQQNGAPAQATHMEVRQEDIKETHTEKVTVDIKTEEVQEDLPKQSGEIVKPGEIPEDQLKKILEVE
ncbi:MAG: hypothetical protein RLY49_302 [Candidatus Parcubacteria bacterium]|jgi:hypothetical protein